MADITTVYTDDEGNIIPYNEAMARLREMDPIPSGSPMASTPAPPGPQPPGNVYGPREGPIRGFTNRPGVAGTQIEPGRPGEWEMVEGTEEPIEATVGEQVGEAVERERERGTRRFVPPTEKLERWARDEFDIPAQPTEEEMAAELPDFSASGREDFRQHIVSTYMGGVDPVTLNPAAEADRIEAQHLEGYFNQFFRGAVAFRDRDKLTGKMKSEWEKAHLRFRSEALRRATYAKGVGMDMLQDKLTRWDKQAAEFRALQTQALATEKAGRKALDAMLEKRRTEARKAPTVKNMVNPKGVLTVHEWDPDARTWVDTGRRAKEERAPSTSATISASRYEDNVLRDLEEGARIPPHQLAAINRHRESLGLPSIIERETKGEKKRRGPKWLGGGIRDWLARDKKATYEYVEEGVGATPTAPATTAPTAGKVNFTAPPGATDDQIKAAIQNAHPNKEVYKSGDNWYIR